MQENKENLSPLNASSVEELVSKNPMMSSPGLFAPYHQQSHDINKMLQSQMTIELCTQLNLLQERAAFCIKEKDNFIEEVLRKNQELETRLKVAMEIAGKWKKLSIEKTALCSNLASNVLVLREREKLKRRVEEMDLVEEAESSVCDNGDDYVDMASSLKCKRRRF